MVAKSERRPLAYLAAAVFCLLAFAVACKSGPSPAEQAVLSYQRGQELQQQGSMRAAGDAYREAIRLNTGYAEAFAGRAYVYYAHQNYPNAIVDLNRAIALKPGLAIAYSYRGMAYAAMGNDQNALLNFTKAIELDARLKDAYYNRATLYVKMDDLGAAVEDLGEVIALDPENTDYYVERAQAYAALGDTGRATVDLEKVISITRDEATSIAARQMLLSLQQRPR